MRVVSNSARMRPSGLVALLLALAGCGGGLFLEIGDRFDDRPPSVSLAVSPGTAAPGQTVRLVAAAADDFGIAQVAFFRIDAGNATNLGADCCAPYELDTLIPIGAAGSVQYFARASDDNGRVSESERVSVAVP